MDHQADLSTKQPARTADTQPNIQPSSPCGPPIWVVDGRPKVVGYVSWVVYVRTSESPLPRRCQLEVVHSTIFPGLEKKIDTAQAKTSRKLSTVLHSSLVHRNALITGTTENLQEVRRAPKSRL